MASDHHLPDNADDQRRRPAAAPIEIPAGEWAVWPWTQCRARREPRPGQPFGRCELRRGHAKRGFPDHALERGFDTPRWSTEWTG